MKSQWIRRTFQILIVITALLIAGCQKDQEQSKKTQHSGMNMQSSAMQQKGGQMTGKNMSMQGMNMKMPAGNNTSNSTNTGMSNMNMPMGKQSDMSSMQTKHSGMNMQASEMQHGKGNMTGNSMNMQGMNMKMPAGSKTPASTNAQMSNMKMPMGKESGMASQSGAEGEKVSGRSPVDLTYQERQLINIRTQPVTRGDAVVTINTVGIVAYDQARVANVNTRIMGWAEKLYVDKPGQFVSRGAPLMAIYSPELYSAQYEYLLSYKNYEKLKQSVMPKANESDVSINAPTLKESLNEAKALMESARKRLALWEIPDKEIRALEKSGKPTDTLQLHSPVSGYVINKNIDPGQMVSPGKTLYLVADLSKIWINADIYEYELPFVKTGQKVAVTALAYPGRVFDAKVDFIYPYSENKTRTTTVRLAMDNREGLFKPNNYVNAQIKEDYGNQLLVPTTAVFDTGTQQYVFVETKEGHFVPRLIILGPRVDDQFVVKKGLTEGEKVVVDGNFLLDSESQLSTASSSGGQ